VVQRFFCHQCSVEIARIAPDYTCPTCNSGFIEELGAGDGEGGGGRQQAGGPGLEEDSDGEDQYDLGQVLGPLESILPGLLGGVGPSRGFGGPIRVRQGPSQRIRISRGPPPPHRPTHGPQNLGMDQAALENALQDFVFNLAGMQFGGPGGAGGAGGAMGAGPVGGAGGGPGGARFHFIGPGAQLHGNPGDYAWGRGGLDAIITQLLNQMDGAGPPPMAKENIQQIPTVKINKQQLEKSQSCSVCWEDFSEGEEVKLLECEHCFHTGCIVPWLELHGTCPVCRKELNKTGEAAAASSAGEEARGPSDPLTGDPQAQGAQGAQGAPGSSTQGAAGGAGLTGFIQSALNQVFGNAGWSSPSQNNTTVSSSSSDTGSNSTSTSTQPPPSRDSNGSDARNTSDEETPAARRQRLDPDFVDLDFD